MSNIFYNVASQDISNGLTDFEVSSGQDYFILLSAPTNANVRVKLNSNTAPAIPIYEFWQFKSADLNKLYISADAVAGASITYGQADGNVEITTNPQIGSIDSITEVQKVSDFDTVLIDKLDKVINPYQSSTVTYGESNSTSFVNILQKTITCDKIKINLTSPANKINGYGYWGGIIVTIDGILITSNGVDIFSTSGTINVKNSIIEFNTENLKNKTLKIDTYSANSSYYTSYLLEEFNYKV